MTSDDLERKAELYRALHGSSMWKVFSQDIQKRINSKISEFRNVDSPDATQYARIQGYINALEEIIRLPGDVITRSALNKRTPDNDPIGTEGE